MQWYFPTVFPKTNNTSLFATVDNISKATDDLNNDVAITKKWTFQWKMSFSPDISKQVHKIIFSRNRSIVSHPLLTFNNNKPVAQITKNI